jgi:CheY-like chemotaxis protein
MSKSALVVDDSKSARFALRKYLENHAYKVDTAESAEQCYEYLKSNRPEVIFLDHVMPGADGFDVLKHIKSDPTTVTIPVVICSSNEGEEFTKQARSRGAADVLQKPPSPDQLVKVLDNLSKLAASLKPAPGKVTPIRPVETGRPAEAAIEEGVMKVVREALPPEPPKPEVTIIEPPHAEPTRVEPPRVQPMPAVPEHAAHAPAMASGAPAAPRSPAGSEIGQLRDHVESRLRKITSELYVQIAELKALVTNLEPAELTAQAIEGFRPTLESELQGLSRSIGDQLDDVRKRLEQMTQSQAQEHENLLRAARAAAASEAQAVAEKVVMNAAANISRQLADAIMQAFGKH